MQLQDDERRRIARELHEQRGGQMAGGAGNETLPPWGTDIERLQEGPPIRFNDSAGFGTGTKSRGPPRFLTYSIRLCWMKQDLLRLSVGT